MVQLDFTDIQDAFNDDDFKSALDSVEAFLGEHPEHEEAHRLKLRCCLQLETHHDFIHNYLFTSPGLEDTGLDEEREHAGQIALESLANGHEALGSYRSRPASACIYFAKALILSPFDTSLPLAVATALLKHIYGKPREKTGVSFEQLLGKTIGEKSLLSRDTPSEIDLMRLVQDESSLSDADIPIVIGLFIEEALGRAIPRTQTKAIRFSLDMLTFNLEALIERYGELEEDQQRQVANHAIAYLLHHVAILLRNEQYDHAQQLLDSLMKVAPGHGYITLMFAEMKRLQEAFDEGLTYCEKLLEPDCDTFPIHQDALADTLALSRTMDVVCSACLKGNQKKASCVYCNESLTNGSLLMDTYPPHQASLRTLAYLMRASIYETIEGGAIEAYDAAKVALDIALKDIKDGDTVSRIRRYVNELDRNTDHMEILVQRAARALQDSTQTGYIQEQIQLICQQDPAIWHTITQEERSIILSRLIELEAISLAYLFMHSAFDEHDVPDHLHSALDNATRELSIRLTGEASTALESGHAETAIDITTEAIRFDHRNIEARRVRAQAFLATGQSISALSALYMVLNEKNNPHREEALRTILMIQEKQGNYREALDLTDSNPDIPIEPEYRQQLERRLKGLPVIKTEELSYAVMSDSLRRIPSTPYWNGYFALTLTSVGRQNINSEAWLNTAFSASYEFVRVLGGLSSIVGDPAISLRFMSDPVPDIPEQGHLTIALVAKLSGPDEETCHRSALDFWRIIKSSMPGFFKQHYQFAPVVSVSDLEAILMPFEYGTLAEIVRRDDTDVSGQDELSAYPLLPGELTLRQVCRVLLGQDAPALLNITLVPTRLLGWEKSLLEKLPATEDETGTQGFPDGLSINVEHYPNSLTHERKLWEQVKVNQHLFSSLRSGAFVMRITVAGAPNTNPLLPEHIATVLLGSTQVSSGGVQGGSQIMRGNTGKQREIMERNLYRVDIENWMNLSLNNDASRLRFLFGEREATFAFRLPVTGRDGLPGVHTLEAKPIAPPANLPEQGVILGDSVYRVSGASRVIRQNTEDRRRHSYIVGKTGTGKSTLLKMMALQDIQAGRGVCVIDPHGDLVEDILLRLPSHRMNDVILFDPSDDTRPIGLNLLQHRTETEKHQIVNEFIALLIRMYDPDQTGIVGPRFQHNVRNAMLTAMSLPDSTLIEVVRVLTDGSFVKKALPYVSDPIVRAYWEKQIANTSDFHKSEILDYIVSKFNRFVGDRRVRHIVGQGHSRIDFRKVMDEKKILLVNLSKGKIGPENAQFLGLLVVQSMLIAALSRADLPANKRADFFMYVDEFQNFATNLFTTILSEGRKYGVALTVANQYLTQLTPSIREAIFGNVGSILSFRLGTQDAHLLATEMSPSFDAHDLMNLPKYIVCAKLLVNGHIPPPFTLQTLPDSTPMNIEQAEAIRQHSRQTYGQDVRGVIEDIDRRFKADV